MLAGTVHFYETLVLTYQCYVKGSGRVASKERPPVALPDVPGEDWPFGFLKATTANDAVNLWVLPYGFRSLFHLISQLFCLPNQSDFRRVHKVGSFGRVASSLGLLFAVYSTILLSGK